jgi:flagellar hook-length control protein FliK
MSAALPVPIQNIAWLSGPQGGIQGLQVQTHIAQLGDVMVRIDMLDGIRRIQHSADNLASAHALSLSAARLEQQVAQAGLQDVRVQVGINSHSPFASFGQHGAADQGRHGQGGGVADLGIALHEAAGGALEQISPQISLTGPHAGNLLA